MAGLSEEDELEFALVPVMCEVPSGGGGGGFEGSQDEARLREGPAPWAAPGLGSTASLARVWWVGGLGGALAPVQTPRGVLAPAWPQVLGPVQPPHSTNAFPLLCSLS